MTITLFGNGDHCFFEGLDPAQIRGCDARIPRIPSSDLSLTQTYSKSEGSEKYGVCIHIYICYMFNIIILSNCTLPELVKLLLRSCVSWFGVT